MSDYRNISIGYTVCVFITLLFLWWLTPSDNGQIENIEYKISSLESQRLQSKSKFQDFTGISGIHRPHVQRSETITGLPDLIGAGACAIDYDRDGWTDILTLNGSGTTHFFGQQEWWQKSKNSVTLYRNINGKRFVDVSDEIKLKSELPTMGCAVADLNNDGWSDIVISSTEKVLIFKNILGATFEDMSEKLQQPSDTWSTTVSLADINRDGLVDIYVSNYLNFSQNSNKFEGNSGYERQEKAAFSPELFQGLSNNLYTNEGDFNFTDATSEYNLEDVGGRSLSSHFVHLNQDLYPDLIVLNDKDSPSKLFINEQKHSFNDLSSELNFQLIERTGSITHLINPETNQTKIFVGTGDESQPREFVFSRDTESNQAPVLISRSNLSNAIPTFKTHWGIAPIDVNLDGKQDLVIANGRTSRDIDTKLLSQGEPNTLLIWNNGGYLKEDPAIAKLENPPISSRCVFTLDFDNDGRKDIFITQNNDYPQLLKNESKPSNWIGIDLNTITSDKMAWPARVVLTTDSTNQVFDRLQTQGFLCSSENRALFNFPITDKVIKLKILWSNGEIQDLTPDSVNNYFKISRRSGLELLNHTQKVGQSKILLNTLLFKEEVLNWLIETDRRELFEQELQTLLESKSEINSEILKLSTKASNPIKTQVLARALQSNDTELLSKAIKYAELAESELLLRWILPLVDHQEESISCKASSVFEKHFIEEEALVIRKFQLARNLLSRLSKLEPSHRSCLIKAIGKSEHYRSIDVLSKLLMNNNPQESQAAAIALRYSKETKALTVLLEILDSPKITPITKLSALASILYIDKKYDPLERLTDLLKTEYLSTAFPAAILDFKKADEEGWVILNSRSNEYLAKHHGLNPELTRSQNVVISAKQNTHIVCKNQDSPPTTPKFKPYRNCIASDQLYKQVPEILLNSLKSNTPSIRKEAFKVLANRKENWAHTLRAASLIDNKLPLQLKSILLENSRSSITKSELKALKKIANDRQQAQLWPQVIPLLPNIFEDKNLETWLKKLEIEIRNNREPHAMNIARGLYNVAPNRTLDRLTASTAKPNLDH